MALKVVQGLIAGGPRQSPTDQKASQGQVIERAQGAPVSNQGAALARFQDIAQAAKAVSATGEAVITTLRASSAKATTTSEVRSSDAADKLARKVAKEIRGGADQESEALSAHSGLDSIRRSGGSGRVLL